MNIEKICANCRHSELIYNKSYVYCKLHNISMDKKDSCKDFRKERQ